ncbi:hypothetical protein J6590_059532 [Homalodisca vitripennis]|nr:hypothetical protein J6590_059532 [Homalodisca vitripennis]
MRLELMDWNEPVSVRESNISGLRSRYDKIRGGSLTCRLLLITAPDNSSLRIMIKDRSPMRT